MGCLLAPAGWCGALGAEVVDEFAAGAVGMSVQRGAYAEGVAVGASGLQVASGDEVVGARISGIAVSGDGSSAGVGHHGAEEQSESSDELHCALKIGSDQRQVDDSERMGVFFSLGDRIDRRSQ